MSGKFITVKDVAGLLNASEVWIKKLVQRKAIPSYKIAGKRLFKAEEIDQWIESHKEEAIK